MEAPLFHDIADGPAGGSAHWADTADGQRIRFAIWPGTGRGTALVFPGRTEYIEKYGRVAAELVRRGFHVLTIDWRGQGLSTRPGGTTDLGHVGGFAEYQQDLTTVLEHPAARDLPKPTVLLAHSMGGCIGLRALHNGLDVSSAIFSAPMWGIGTGRLQGVIGRTLTAIAVALGFGQRHLFGTTSAHFIATAPFEGNSLTNNRTTWDWLKAQLDAHPELGLGGPSMRWAYEALCETAALSRLPPPKPVLTMLGTAERVVSPRAIIRQMAKPGAGKLVTFDNAQHELLMEIGAVQDRAWDEIDAWLP